MGMLPSGKHTKNYGKIHHFLMGKSTISMAMFNSYVKLPEGNGKKHVGHIGKHMGKHMGKCTGHFQMGSQSINTISAAALPLPCVIVKG